MKYIFGLLTGILCFWCYQEDVFTDLMNLAENRGDIRKTNHTLNILDTKVCDLSNDLFSGFNIYGDKEHFNISRPLDLSEHVRHITRGCINHDEKIKAVYQWITHNIEYDTDYNIYMPDECYIQRKGVCNAYALLMVKMLACEGIRAVRVSGLVKTEAHEEPGRHAWVMIEKADGSFMLADPTWDAGYVDREKNKFFRLPSMDWYDINPKEMIRTHFPFFTRHQLLNRPFSKEEFLNQSI